MPISNQDLTKPLNAFLDARGYQGKIVSIGHIRELEAEILARLRKGLLDAEVYRNYMASFDFTCHRKFRNARSLIIASAPQPQMRVTFLREEKSYAVIIPPTYSYGTDYEVATLLKAYLEPRGYQLKRVRLPEKLLAVRSGLAKYGKNNITYVEGMGSFHRPVVFISDVPSTENGWEEPLVLDQCENCHACEKACPTNAIGSDRFQLYAERCLTFHNERANDFPDWLSSAWHNSLVGCMICQKVCPANKNFVKRIENGASFNLEETDLILSGVSEERLPRKTVEKLKEHGIMEYYHSLARNLRALIEK